MQTAAKHGGAGPGQAIEAVVLQVTIEVDALGIVDDLRRIAVLEKSDPGVRLLLNDGCPGFPPFARSLRR